MWDWKIVIEGKRADCQARICIEQMPVIMQKMWEMLDGVIGDDFQSY